MNTVPSPPDRPNPAARAPLVLDRDVLRLSSPRGDAVSGFITLTLCAVHTAVVRRRG